MKKLTIKTPNKLFYLAIMAVAFVGTVVLFNANAATSNSRFPGDPNPLVTGKAYWGASVDGNEDPYVRFEQPTGKSLSIRRTFWGWGSRASGMVSTAATDISKNRLPWVSIKTPTGKVTDWAKMADGTYDSQIDEMLIALDNIGGPEKPVWFTLWHEPENDSGNLNDWVAMQKRVRARMNALKNQGKPMDNIAFAPIMMSWTFNPTSGRKIDDWILSGIQDKTWDFIGIDPYCYTICSSKGKTVLNDGNWDYFVNYLTNKKVPMAIGEWGETNSATVWAQVTRQMWEYGFTNKKDILGYAEFDSGLNPPAGDPGVDTTMPPEVLAVFLDILKNDIRVQRVNELNQTTPPTPTPDPTPDPGALPINISSPAAGSSVSGTVNVTTAPDTDVEEVSFRVNGTWQYTASSAPFSWSWDTTKFANGDTTLTIRARKVGDPGGTYTEKSIQVTVNNSAPPQTAVQCDFDGNRVVGLPDLAILLAHYGTSVTANTNGDCDGNGLVNLQDMAKLLSLYGQ